MNFTIEAEISGGRGRAGIIKTINGEIKTPAFIPVGTKATVKSLTTDQIREYIGAEAILANTYHLYLQPGIEVIKKSGGLGKFMNWHGPTFTDSGGFQAFSLGSNLDRKKGKILKTKDEINKLDNNLDNIINEEKPVLAKIDDKGVTFKSIIDGSMHLFTPERSIEIQRAIGADIIFAFDECLSPFEPYEKQKQAIERTRLWAKRCLDYFSSTKGIFHEQALFGIVQGGRYQDLRELSAKNIAEMDFDGFGIGGSFDKDDIGIAVGWVADKLPKAKPRHLLGIGEPEDLILGIENGMDTFDCVAPTRIARNGGAYIRSGKVSYKRINLFNSCFIDDLSPIDQSCQCYTCKGYTKSYISHLFRSKEMLAATLLSIHNLYFLVDLVKRARTAILDGKWKEFREGLY